MISAPSSQAPVTMTPQESMDALIDYGPGLKRSAIFLGLLEPDAEDAVQETLLRACQSYETIKDPCPLVIKTWLHTVLRNYIFNEARRKYPHVGHSRHRQKFPEQEMFIAGERDLSEAFMDKSPYIPDVIINRELFSIFMGGLNEEDRKLFDLRYNHDLELKEIASKLGIEENAAKVRHFRAIQAFRKQLKAEDENMRLRKEKVHEPEAA